MEKTKMLPSHKMNEYMIYEYSNAFVKMRGACKKTQTLPRHKTNDHTKRKAHTQDNMNNIG